LGPYVLPGTYTVALVADGRVVDSKSLRIVMDPAVELSEGARVRYNAVLADLHELQRRATDVARPLAALFPNVQATAPRVDSSSAPANVKQDFADFRKEFDAVRAKFGVGAGGGFGGGGGGGGGAAAQAALAANALGRLSALKSAIIGMWEAPSEGTMRQVEAARAALVPAMNEVAPVMAKAKALSLALSQHGVTLTVPDTR
jgi:hypothetical protein